MDLTGKRLSFAAPLLPPAFTGETPSLDRQWRQEWALLWVRWAAVIVWLALTPIVPSAFRALLVVVAVAFGMGNGVVWWLLRRNARQLLRRPPDWMDLRRAQIVATGTD